MVNLRNLNALNSELILRIVEAIPGDSYHRPWCACPCSSKPVLIQAAHPTDIFALAATSTQLISASGSSSLKIYSTTDSEFPLRQVLEKTHRLGCHHIVVSGSGNRFASAGFAGEVKVWGFRDGSWVEEGLVTGESPRCTSRATLS
jgi:hypothetical protein